MGSNEIYKDEWLERAFCLAFFLHRDRDVAKRIAVGAMNKLETASNAQFKRLYYTPTGRADAQKASRSRVSLSDLQLLQRLVLVESEIYEREKEKDGRASEADLLRYFIKHLVRIALKRNSFYVTLAVSRILHSYATADAMDIYNVVVQDPERVRDDHYFRSRKGLLMKEMKARFGELIEVVKVGRGEERFDRRPDAEELKAQAAECLHSFTPWNSTCSLPEKFDVLSDVIAPLHFDKADPDEEHRTEVNRIHAALHPDCFNRLAHALELRPPNETLEIPKFMIAENRATDRNDNGGSPPSLEPDELLQIKQVLAAQAASRKAAAAGFLRVVIDGNEVGRLDGVSVPRRRFKLDGNAELIEVRAEDGTLLATHLLDLALLADGPVSQTVEIDGQRRVTFELMPGFDEYSEVESLEMEVGYAGGQRPVFSRAKALVASIFAGSYLKPALALGIILLAAAVGWFVLRDLRGRSQEIVGPTPSNGTKEKAPQASSSNLQIVPKNEVASNASRSEDDEKTDGPLRSPRPERAAQDRKNPPLPRKAVRENVPQMPGLETIANNPVQKDEIDENGILRVPVREPETRLEPDRNKTEVRGNRRLEGKPLGQIRYLFVEITGDAILGSQIAAQVAERLNHSRRFTITPDSELAEAKLKLYVRHESDVDDPDEKTVAVIVRMVNAKGFVIYPNRKKVSAWKYVGSIKDLPSRVASDLIGQSR